MSQTTDTITVLLCGVGGQGTVLAADVLARVATAAGNVVKVSEIHGMAQRGGSVVTVVRFGSEVSSMVCDKGCADVIVSFETTEALRALPYLKQGGQMIVSDETIKPLPVATGKASMPSHACERLINAGAKILPALQLAQGAGSAKTSNVVLLGALASELSFSDEVWIDVIKHRVPPKTIDANIAAFKAGRAFA